MNYINRFNRVALRFVFLLLSPFVLTVLLMVIVSLIVSFIKFTMGYSFLESYSFVMGLPGLYMLFGVITFVYTLAYVFNEVDKPSNVL